MPDVSNQNYIGVSIGQSKKWKIREGFIDQIWIGSQIRDKFRMPIA